MYLLYKPERGKIWDPSIFWHDGIYYMFSMHMDDGATEWNGMWLATSRDGVYWKGLGRVLEGLSPIWKMFIFKCGDKFILNHGSLSGKEGHGNDTLSFFESKDLVNWKHIGDNNPDPSWYNVKERWDHMYVIPKDNENHEKGYWGYVVATPIGDTKGAWGMQQSEDGIKWEAIKPPDIEWGNIQSSKEFEGGGCERIGDKYYYIGGCCPPYMGNFGYSVYTFTADNPTGPFKPDTEAFRLCGFSGIQGKMFVQGLAAMFKAKEELLISNYLIPGAGVDDFDNACFLPIKKAVVDDNGHLHLGYWEKNEIMKGIPIDINVKKCAKLFDDTKNMLGIAGDSPEQVWEKSSFNVSDDSLEMQTAALNKGFQVEDKHMIAVIDTEFDLEKGIVFEGILKAYENPKKEEIRSRCWRPSLAGLYIEEGKGTGTGILLEVGVPQSRHSYISSIRYEDKLNIDNIDVTGPGCATIAGIDSVKDYSFRLFLRKDIFELYVNDLLVQTYITQNTPTGRLGFVIQNARCILSNLTIWHLI